MVVTNQHWGNKCKIIQICNGQGPTIPTILTFTVSPEMEKLLMIPILCSRCR